VRLPAAGSILVRPVILRRGVLNKILRAGRAAAKAVGTRSVILNLVIMRRLRRITITARRRRRSAIAPQRRHVTVRRITVRRLRRNTRRQPRRHRMAVEAGAIRKADIRTGVVADTTADKKFPLGRSSLLTEPERPFF